ncbi:MAG: hypothetical protein DHS20C18_56180 [Saprospiraceae bacterium]|nr:MAG: hypothetical protein DHS20C18_56180 [Saprospiraceae bacterium]
MLGKLYHNTTSKYNGYFNANELLEASTLQLEAQHQDNYNKILEMYKYVAADNPQVVASDLDKAMEKVSVVVNLHRQSIWTDDCYLLLGKAQFLKQDYETAEETFRYMVDEFSPSAMAKKNKKLKKRKKGKAGDDGAEPQKKSKKQVAKEKKKKAKARKKANKQAKKNRKNNKKGKSRKKTTDKKDTKPVTKEEKPSVTETTVDEEDIPFTGMIHLTDTDQSIESDPEGYFMKHRPAYQESVLWLCKTLIERDRNSEAMRLLAQLEKDAKTFPDIRREAAALKAYNSIRRKNYAQAVTQLNEAIELEKNGRTKARYAYIIGQLQQKQGNGDAAYAAFESVLKHNPTFEMEFSSKLKMAQNAWLSGKGTAADAIQNLEKMLNEDKNADFKDQIYYALADIALKQGNRQEALKNLSLSLQNSLSNRSQRSEAYYALGNLFFENEDYVSAKSYFDSTLLVMPNTDERYGEVDRMAKNLSDIADRIMLIELQDSLLSIGRLSDDEKKAMALEIKEKEEAKRQAAQAAQAQKETSTPGKYTSVNGRRPGGTALTKESSFFAYDARAVKRGKREFERKWGARELVDDWRRSNRTGSDLANLEEEFTEIPSATLDDEEVAKLLGDIPSSPGEIAIAEVKIKEAMYELGGLYRERLKNNKKCIEVLEKLNEKYPGNNYELESWYLLYLTHKDEGNHAIAQTYYDKIQGKFPTSNYAQMLKDPDFAAKFLNEEKRQNLQYNEIYSYFDQGKYNVAFERSKEMMDKLLGQHPLKPRYALLVAMCTGNIQGKEAYVTQLQEVIARYPDTPEQKRAKEILRILGVTSARLPGEEKEEKSDFEFKENELHYIIIVFNEDIRLTENKAKVSDYNREYHKLDKIRISNVYLGKENDVPVLVLRRFKDKNEAMKYYYGVEKNKGDFIDSKISYTMYAVAQSNYRNILKAKTVEGYDGFFRQNYLK